MTVRFSRRSILLGLSALAVPPRAAARKTPPLLDHLLLGCRELDAGITFVEQSLGVKAAFGGVHPGRGTRNALLALGGRRYLEIIAPDPAQPQSPDARELYEIKLPKLIGWAVHVDDIEAVQKRLEAAHIAFDPVSTGSRQRPSGETLRWRALGLKDDSGGLLPFFIEWDKSSPHPSTDAPAGCELTTFEVAAPEELPLAKLQVEAAVRWPAPAALRAGISGPRGSIQLG